MTVITSMNVARAITKLVAADALPGIIDEMVLGNLVYRDFEPMLGKQGDQINIQLPRADGSLGNLRIVLSRCAEATFQVPDVTKVLCIPDLLRIYARPALNAITGSIERDLARLRLHLPEIAGNVQYVDTIDDVESCLFEAGVPTSEPKFLVVGPKNYSAIRKITGFTEYYNAAEAGLQSLVNGPVGRVKGLYVVRSQHAGSGCDLAFAKQAMAIVMRRLPEPLADSGAYCEYAELGNFGIRVTLSYQPNTLSQQFTIDCLYGVGIIKKEFGLQINSSTD